MPYRLPFILFIYLIFFNASFVLEDHETFFVCIYLERENNKAM